MTRHLHCAEQHQIVPLPRKVVTLQNVRKRLKHAETSFTVRGRAENDPSMIPELTRQSATCPLAEVPRRAIRPHFVWKNKTFCAPANKQKLATSHQILHLPRKVTGQDHQILQRPRKVTSQDQQTVTKYCACHEKRQAKITK